MVIPISEGIRPSRRTDMGELIYAIIFLQNKKLPWKAIKGKNHVEKCKKMAKIKKNINIEELFENCPSEFIHIYKSILKLEYKERPNYELFFIIFKNNLNRFNILDEEKQTIFVQGKINRLLKQNSLIRDKNSEKSLKDLIFKGYPLNE